MIDYCLIQHIHWDRINRVAHHSVHYLINLPAPHAEVLSVYWLGDGEGQAGVEGGQGLRAQEFPS
jgi:hypothetical protein